MIPPIACLAVLVLPVAQESIASTLEAGDFALAWQLAERAPSALERARGHSEILYRAGDPAGALKAAREGLVESPGDLELLFRATGAALWLAEPRLAGSLAERLTAAVDERELAPEHREGWEAAARDFRQQAEQLAERDATRRAALKRARATAWGVGLALVGIVAGIAFAGRGAQGRSRSPVS